MKMTKEQKAKQAVINEKVMKAIEDYNAKGEFIISKTRLRYCTAEVYETQSYYALRSYNTIVALVEKETGICYDFLRYVYGFIRTSAQHISKFRHDYTQYPWNAPVYTWMWI